MAISYEPFLKVLKDKEISKTEVVESTKLSWSTLAKMNKGEYVSLEVIDRLCSFLNVQPGQLIEYIENKK